MFKPPADKTPFLPPANTVEVNQITSTVPLVDQYAVTPTDSPPSPDFILSVTSGLAIETVDKLASGTVAWAKFRKATLQPADLLSPLQLQLALMWFLQNIGRPDYGL